jgi:hypothetical protein
MKKQKQRLIYALCCPFTGDVHYVGQTGSGMMRPLSHLSKSHSEKIREWVNNLKELGHKPDVQILEYVAFDNDLDERERFWIKKNIDDGAVLLNEVLVSSTLVKSKLDKLLDPENVHPTDRIRKFIMEKRKYVNLTQKQLSQKSGVGLRFIRELEQGHKKSLNIGKVQEILNLFGYTIDVIKVNQG